MRVKCCYCRDIRVAQKKGERQAEYAEWNQIGDEAGE